MLYLAVGLVALVSGEPLDRTASQCQETCQAIYSIHTTQFQQMDPSLAACRNGCHFFSKIQSHPEPRELNDSHQNCDVNCEEVYTVGGAEVPACRKGCMAYADAITLRDFPSFEEDPIANLFSSMDNIFGSRPMQHLLGRRPERIERPRVLNSAWGRKDDDFFEPFEFNVVNGDGLFGRLHSQMSNMLQNMPIQSGDNVPHHSHEHVPPHSQQHVHHHSHQQPPRQPHRQESHQPVPNSFQVPNQLPNSFPNRLPNTFHIPNQQAKSFQTPSRHPKSFETPNGLPKSIQRSNQKINSFPRTNRMPKVFQTPDQLPKSNQISQSFPGPDSYTFHSQPRIHVYEDFKLPNQHSVPEPFIQKQQKENFIFKPMLHAQHSNPMPIIHTQQSHPTPMIHSNPMTVPHTHHSNPMPMLNTQHTSPVRQILPEQLILHPHKHAQDFSSNNHRHHEFHPNERPPMEKSLLLEFDIEEQPRMDFQLDRHPRLEFTPDNFQADNHRSIEFHPNKDSRMDFHVHEDSKLSSDHPQHPPPPHFVKLDFPPDELPIDLNLLLNELPRIIQKERSRHSPIHFSSPPKTNKLPQFKTILPPPPTGPHLLVVPPRPITLHHLPRHNFTPKEPVFRFPLPPQGRRFHAPQSLSPGKSPSAMFPKMEMGSWNPFNQLRSGGQMTVIKAGPGFHEEKHYNIGPSGKLTEVLPEMKSDSLDHKNPMDTEMKDEDVELIDPINSAEVDAQKEVEKVSHELDEIEKVNNKKLENLEDFREFFEEKILGMQDREGRNKDFEINGDYQRGLSGPHRISITCSGDNTKWSDWVACIHEKVGVPRWLTAATISLGIVFSIWLCLVIPAAAPKQKVKQAAIVIAQTLSPTAAAKAKEAEASASAAKAKELEANGVLDPLAVAIKVDLPPHYEEVTTTPSADSEKAEADAATVTLEPVHGEDKTKDKESTA